MFVLFCSVAVLVSALSNLKYCYNKIEISHNGRREINRMCKKITRYLRHESSQILGQQSQIIFAEENIAVYERRRHVEFHNFIYFVSYYTNHKLQNNDVRFLFSFIFK